MFIHICILITYADPHKIGSVLIEAVNQKGMLSSISIVEFLVREQPRGCLLVCLYALIDAYKNLSPSVFFFCRYGMLSAKYIS